MQHLDRGISKNIISLMNEVWIFSGHLYQLLRLALMWLFLCDIIVLG